MDAVRIRAAVPASVERGEVFEVKTLIAHPMDNGFMFSRDGERIPGTSSTASKPATTGPSCSGRTGTRR